MAYIVFGAIGMLTIALLGLLGPATIMLIILAIVLGAFGMIVAPHPIFFALLALVIMLAAMAMWGSK